MFFRINKTKTISTTIPEEMYKDVLNLGWKHNELYKLGYAVKKKNPLMDNVEALRKENENRKNEYWELRRRHDKLILEMEKIKGSVK